MSGDAVTEWFCGDVWPVRHGWYEVATPPDFAVTRCWFSGSWSLAAPVPGFDFDTRIVWGPRSRWRGLSAVAANELELP